MTIVFQFISAIGQVAAVFYTLRLLALVGRPKAGALVTAGLTLLAARTVYALTYNTGQYDRYHSVVIAELLMMLFSLSTGAGLYFLRIHARTRALSRLNPQTATAPPGPASAPSPRTESQAIDDAGDPQIICNSDMEITDLNQGASRLLGHERGDICGKSITNIVRKEEMLLVPELFRQSKAGEAHGGEWSFRKPDDTLVPVRISVRSHFNDQVRLIVHDLTEERQAQQSTCGQSQNVVIIGKLLDASSEAFVAYDQDLKIVAWNTRMEKLTGIPRAQCLGQHLLMHFPIPEELAEEDHFLDTLEGHSNDLSQTLIINPETGDEETVDQHFAPLLDDAEEIIGGMVVIRRSLPAPVSTAASPAAESEEPAAEPVEEPQPIAFEADVPAPDEPPAEPAPPMPEPEWPAAEPVAGPDDSAVLLNNIFTAAPHIIAVYDLVERRHLFVNRTLPHQLGFNDAMIAAMGEDYLSEIIHPEDQPNLPRTTAAWNDGTGVDQRITEFRAIDPERNWHWYLATDRVLEHAADGTVRTIVSIIEDITGQKESERRLRLGEQKYRTFSEHCPTGIWHLTAGGNTHYMNPAMRRILGVDSVAELEGRTCHEFITADSQLNIATHSTDPAAAEPAAIEVDLQRDDGSLRHCILHGIPDLDEAGQIRNLMGSFLDVTDRSESERAIKAEQARYRAIVEQTPDLICRFDKDGRLSFVNGAYCEFFGQTRDELRGGPFAPKIPADEAAVIAEILDSLDPAMAPRQFTCRVLSTTASERSTRWTIHAVSDEAGSFIEYQAIARDITDQLAAERALAVSERKFRGLFEQSGVGIVALAPDGSYLEANKAYSDFIGYSPEELRSLSVAELTYADDRAATAGQINALVSDTTDVLELDKRYTKKDGTMVWAHVAARAVRNDAGETDHLIAAIQDITTRHQAEDALRASEERANLAIDGTSDGIWDWRVDSDEVYYSPRFEELLGLEPNTLPPAFRVWRELFHPDESERIMQRLNEHLESRDHYADEVRLRHGSGEYRWYRIRGSVTGTGEGGPTRMSGSLTDIDGEVKAREALRSSEATFRSLAENTSAVPWRMDPTDRRFTFVGPQAERIFSHPTDDWTEAGFFELYLHEDDQWVVDHLARHLEQDRDFQFEYRFRTAADQVKWVHQVVHVDKTEGTANVSGFLIDITARKEAELALADRERQFRDLCTHAPAGIFLNGPDANCAFANPKCRDLIGLAEDEDPQAWRERLHPDDRAEVAASFDKSVSEQTAFHREYRFQHADGKVVSVRGEIVPQFNENKELTGFIGTLVDLTALKQAEQKLREKEALLTSAIDSLPFDIWACDRDSRYILQNQSSENRWGNRVGKKPEECGIDPQIVELWHRNNHRALAGETVIGQVQYPHEDQLRDFHSIVAPIQEGDEIVGFLGANIDVTDLKNTEAALRKVETELADAVKAREAAAADLQKIDSELTTARTRIAAAETARDDEKKVHLDCAAELEAAKAALAESKAAGVAAKEALAEAAARQDSLEASLAESEAARDAAQATLNDVQAELDNTVNSLTDTERARQQAQTKLGKAEAALQAAKSQLEETETVHLEVQTSHHETVAALAAAQAALAEAESARNEAKTARDEAEAALKDTCTQLTDATASLTDAARDRDQAQAELENTSTALQAVKAQLAQTETVRVEIQTSHDEISAALAAAQAALAETEAARDAAGAAHDKAAQELNQTKTSLSKSEAERNELNAVRQKAEAALKEAHGRLANTTTLLTDAERERDQAQAELENTGTELQAAKARLAETETVQLEVQTTRTETGAALAAAQAALAAAEADRDEAEAARDKSEQELNQTKTALSNSETERRQAEAKQEALDASLEAARKEAETALKAALAELANATSSLTDAERERDQAQAELGNTKTGLQAAEARLAETEAVQLEIKTSHHETGAALAAAQAALAAAEVVRDEAKSARDKAEQELTETQAALTKNEAARRQAETEHEALAASFEAARLAATEAEAKRAANATELALGKTELEQTKKALTEAEGARTAAQTALSESETRLQEIASSLAASETALAENKKIIGELEAKSATSDASMQEAAKALAVNQLARRESERRMAILLHNIPGIAYRRQTGDSRTLDYISVGCASLTGHAPEEFTSGTVSLANLIHPDDREQVAEAISAATAAKARYQVEYRLTHADGTERKVAEQGCGVFENDEDLIAISGVITEIAPRPTLDLSDSPINTLPECIWITDVNDRTVFFNQSWCEITGNDPNAGLDWTDSVHGEDRARITRAFKDAVADRERFDQELRLRRQDGVYLWMRMIAVPRRDTRNRFTGYMGSCFDVSPSIHDREELKANQRQLEWAQTRAKLGSWEYHPGRNFRRWSRQTMELYNRRPEQGLPADFDEFLEHIHEDDRQRLTATNDLVMKTGRAIGNLEFRTNPDRGPLRHLTATVYRVPEEDGSAYYLAGTVMDVSDQKATEGNVRRSEERYRKIIEIAEEGVWMMDAEGYTSFVNPRMMQMLGYRYREFIGRHFFEFLQNESIKDAEEYLERRQQGISEQAEFIFLRRDGKPVNVLINSSSLKDADGDFIGVLCMVSDITARKAATAKLDETQKKIRTVLKTAPDFIMSVDDQKIIRFVNRPYAGMNPEQVIGTPALNWITPDDRESYEAAIQSVFTSGEAGELEVRGLGAGGASAWYFTRIGPVKEEGKVNSLIIVSQDITQRKTAQSKNVAYENRLRVLSRKLLAAQETERRMIANELHDEFGQALSAAKLNLQALARSKQTDKDRQRLTSSLESLEHLIQQTRRLSLELRPSVLDDLGLVPALRWLVSNQADSVGYELRFDAPEIDRFDADLEAAAFRVTQEALTNIARHSKAKKVSVKLARTATDLRLEISDNGAGFDVAAARAAAARGDSLGLLGMEERITLVGGAIEITSAPGKGTSIVAHIPLPATAPAPAVAAKAKKKAKAKRAPRKKSK